MPRTAEATVRDGIKICYRIWGEAGSDKQGGKRIALVHPLAMNAEFWGSVAELLLPDFEVLALDCRGHGQSDKAAGPYHVEQYADDLADVLDHAGWETSMVAGASMGGCVALAFTTGYPYRVTGLGLFDTTSYYGANAPEVWEERAQKALEGGMSALVDFQKTRWFGEAFHSAQPAIVDEAIKVFLANDVNCYAETCRMLGRCDQRAALSGFAVPTEILVGEEDYATPVEMAQAMADAIANAKMTVLKNARHFSPLEAPGAIADAIKRLAEARQA